MRFNVLTQVCKLTYRFIRTVENFTIILKGAELKSDMVFTKNRKGKNVYRYPFPVQLLHGLVFFPSSEYSNNLLELFILLMIVSAI